MILVIGGAASGKRTYVRSLGYADAQMQDAQITSRPVVYNLQDMVSRDPENAHALFDALVLREVIICNEVGSGVIPANPAECIAREETGRLLIRLAKRADRVVRMVCGIPTVIKGD